MTLKLRLSIFISVLFTFLYGITFVAIIAIYSDFRQDEFRARLEEKALTTIKLLLDVKEVDNQLLKIIDQNTINKLYDEKTLVFDNNYQLIYSSLDDTKVNWTKKDLDYLKTHKTFFKKDGDNEIYGIFYDSNAKDFYALISANDNYGKRKLEFLMWLMLGAYVVFTGAGWLLTFYVVGGQLRPLSLLHQKISDINEHNLETRLPAKTDSENEIQLLSKEFNFMMERIHQAYARQKEFTAQASHELRTPIARLAVQLSNLKSNADLETSKQIEQIEQNIFGLNDLIHSLLLLSRSETGAGQASDEIYVDELVYEVIEKMHLRYPDFKARFDIDERLESLPRLQGNPILLQIALENLLKNAYLYSDSKQAAIKLQADEGTVKLFIENDGPTLSEAEQKTMFQPFMRGENSAQKAGLGLGLRIVQRILNSFGYDIAYRIHEQANSFVIDLKMSAF